MKNYLPFFLIFLVSCLPEEKATIPAYEERSTLEILEKSEAILTVSYSSAGSTDRYVTLIEKDSEKNLIVFDTTLVHRYIQENGWTNFKVPFTGDIFRFLENYQSNQNPLKVLVSGQIKNSHPKDTIPGLPFSLEKIESIPSCPVSFSFTSENIPLQNTSWIWKGFVDEEGRIYSYPSCENPLVTLLLTTKEVSSSDVYMNPNYPKAMFLDFHPGFPFRDWINNSALIYELSRNDLSIYSAWKIRPLSPGQSMAGASLYTTSRTTGEKADSLYSLLMPGKVELEANGNKLVLIRPDNGIRALFVKD